MRLIIIVEAVVLAVGVWFLVHRQVRAGIAADAQAVSAQSGGRAGGKSGDVPPRGARVPSGQSAAEGAAANGSALAFLRSRERLPALRDPRLVVEKSAHRLTVYDGSSVVKSYRAAIGAGKGDKVREGDMCTPEGEFYVCLKNPQSRYVLALGLSYPSIEDAARGIRDGLIGPVEYEAIVQAIRRRRQPPWRTALGGEIMIHGCGAGRDWTEGCIALDDGDIRELYRAVPVGTPVKILP